MAEVEKKIAAGDLPAPLSESEKRRVDEMQPMIERIKMLAPSAPPLSDKPPVKVRFLPDEGEGALPGWMRKGEGNRPSGSGEAATGGAYSETDTGSEGSIPLNTDTAPVRSDGPLSPSSLPGKVESPPSPQGVADIEKQLTPELPTAAGIETQLSERFSPERLQKARQVLERYGPEEGLRRLRADDPEVAAQFEQTRRARNPAESETAGPENLTQ